VKQRVTRKAIEVPNGQPRLGRRGEHMFTLHDNSLLPGPGDC
jgi:hypothetical protein